MTVIPLPARLVATYYPLWWNARIASAPTSYNQVYLFDATPKPGGNGAFVLDYPVSPADIATVRGRGQRVVLSCGGAGAGFNFTTRAQSTNFVNSVTAMITKLGGGIDGVDLNTFEQIKQAPAEMIWIAQQLKATYGPSFTISCPLAAGAGYAPNDRALIAAMAKAGVLDYAGPQFYDDSSLTTEAVLEQLIPQWVTNLGGDASKVVLGVGSNYSGGGSTSTTLAAWKKLVARYPHLRGVFGWSAQDDAAKSWSFAKAVAPVVLAAP